MLWPHCYAQVSAQYVTDKVFFQHRVINNMSHSWQTFYIRCLSQTKSFLYLVISLMISCSIDFYRQSQNKCALRSPIEFRYPKGLQLVFCYNLKRSIIKDNHLCRNSLYCIAFIISAIFFWMLISFLCSIIVSFLNWVVEAFISQLSSRCTTQFNGHSINHV